LHTAEIFPTEDGDWNWKISEKPFYL